eukprot:3192847-Pleurochrysis_carterae.AAC.1
MRRSHGSLRACSRACARSCQVFRSNFAVQRLRNLWPEKPYSLCMLESPAWRAAARRRARWRCPSPCGTSRAAA